MARKMRRRYNGMVRIPGLSGMLDRSVNTKDVVVGALVGFAGTGAIKYLNNTILAGKVPEFIAKGSPLIGGAVSGGIAYMLQRQKNPARANGHLTGALLAGASVQVWDMLKANMPQVFGDVVSLNLSNYGSVFVDEKTPSIGPGGYGGLLVDEPSHAMSGYNLAQLAEASMNDSEDDGIEALMEE